MTTRCIKKSRLFPSLVLARSGSTDPELTVSATTLYENYSLLKLQLIKIKMC
jgi:hypothetical protein